MLNIWSNQIDNYVVNVILSILIALIICFLYFIFTRFILKNKKIIMIFERNKKIYYLINYFLGTLLSLSSLIYLFDNKYILSINFFSIIALSYFFNYWFSIGTFSVNIIINSILINNNKLNNYSSLGNYYIVLNYVILVISLGCLLLMKFIKWRNNFIFLLINSTTLIACIIVCFPLVFKRIWLINEFEQFIFGFNFIIYILISYLVYAIIHLITKFNNKNQWLNQDIKYQFGFIKTEYANHSIHNFIKYNKVDRALVIKFFIFGLDNLLKQYDNVYIKKIKQKIFNLLQEELKQQEILFFLKNENSYFALLKIEDNEMINLKKIIINNSKNIRSSNDYLKTIEIILKKIVNKMNNEEIYFSLTCLCTLYGVVSNDIDVLCNNIDQIKLNYWPYNNIVYYESLSSGTILNNSINKNQILKELNKFNNKDIFINLYKIKDEQYQNNIVYYPEAYSLIPLYENKKEIINLSKNLNVQSAIICHLAAKEIIEFKKLRLNEGINNILLLDYSQYLLEQENFNLDNLLNNINFYGLNKNQFILNIYCYHNEFNKIFIKNLNILKSNNIKYKLQNYQKSKTKNIHP